jgi:TRAP-type C4-dicarboxylate transport system substrate-binding protein
MKRILRNLTAAAVVAVAMGASSGAVNALETIRLTIASSHPTAVPWVGVMKDHVVPESNKKLEAMGSDYRIKWTESYGGALFKYDKTLESVRDGITDVGWVGTLWEESQMPLQNVTFHTPFVSDDLPKILGLMNQLHKDVPELNEAWEKQNQIFLGASGIETYHLLTKEPVNSLADLKGMKIIAAGSVGNWLKGTGAAPVNAGLPGFYNLLKTGVADGVLIAFSGAFPFKLYEVAPYITKVGIGAQMTGGMTINKSKWDKLPEDVQQVLIELGEEYTIIHAEKLMKLAGIFEAKMVEAGATVSVLNNEERLIWVETLPDLASEWRDASESQGAAATKVLNAYMLGLQKLGVTPSRNWGE